MKLLFVIVFYVLFFLNSRGQQPYHIVKEIATQELIKPEDDLNKICFRVCKDTLYQLRIIKKSNEIYSLKITSFKLESGNQIRCDTISGLPRSFNISDFTISNGYMLIVGNEQYIFFDLKNISGSIYLYPENLEYKDDPHPFKYCQNINDSSILLYTIYNYHPADGKAGVYLKILNTRTKQCNKLVFMPMPGIGITHISGNWISVIKNKIYLITPLSGDVYVLDLNFNILNKTSLPVFNKTELTKSLRYQSYIDSVIDNESKRIIAITRKYPKDSLQYHRSEYASPVYAKEFISNTIREVREKHSYIENVFTVDDSLIAISVSGAGYSTKFRDVFFYNPGKDKIVKEYMHFPCTHPDSLSKPEDFFTINLTYGKLLFPYIHNNHVYCASFHPLSSFQTGKFDDLSFKLFNATKNTGYKWTIFKHRLD